MLGPQMSFEARLDRLCSPKAEALVCSWFLRGRLILVAFGIIVRSAKYETS